MKRPAHHSVSDTSVRARDLRNQTLARLSASAVDAVAGRVRNFCHASTRRTAVRKG